jgi:hypothetical protein
LASTDASIVVRALCLAAMLTKHNEGSCQEFLQFGSINYIIEYLNSSNENFRVEALEVLENISEFPLSIPYFAKHQILTRVQVLLEEGLQMKSDAGYEQARCSIRILRSFAKNSSRVTEEFHSFGVIQSLSKAFFS